MSARPLALVCLLAAVTPAVGQPLRAIAVEEIPAVDPNAGQVVLPPSQQGTGVTERVISSTGQFRITGGESQDRGTIAMLAEEAKKELLDLTEELNQQVDRREDWKVPVTIRLHGRSGDAMPPRTVAMRLLFNETGYEVLLDVHLSRGIEHERFKYAVTSALIHERTLRNLPARESDVPFTVPPWLVEGLREATAWRLDQSDRRLYEALFRTGGLYKLEEVFALDEEHFENNDGAMRAAFRVSSGALVMALLQQPQGKAGFRAFLNEVSDFQGEMPALLRKHFPELNLSETSLSKWWALQLANIGGQNLASDVYSISKTDEMLTETLRLNFRTAEGIIQQKDISAWPEIAELTEQERVGAVRLAQDQLVRLSYRCFPSYRPMLSEYQVVLGSIARNKTKDVEKQLAGLSQRRTVMVEKAAHGKEYLVWFELTRAREPSDAFDDYMRLKEKLKDNPHKRSDDLSKYLDRMDAIFSRGLADKPAAEPVSDFPMEIPDLPPIPDLPN